MVSKGALKYIVKRAIVLYTVTVIAIYLTIVISNLGGMLDAVVKEQIYLSILNHVKTHPDYKDLPPVEQDELIESMYRIEIKARGLDTPFPIRSLVYLKDALTLDLGRALYLTSDTGSRRVRLILLERLPTTVMLFTTSAILGFIMNVSMGLYLSRHHGSKLDKLIISLAPTSIAPSWLYGIFLIIIFASMFRMIFGWGLPYGGLVSVPPPEDPISYALSVLEHMILPLSSLIISGLFMGFYGSRTFFLIFSTEDYVRVAKAKGLPPRMIERRYIFRPVLNPIITGLFLSLIGSWMGAIITETVFGWPGLGLVMSQAISAMDTPVLVGATVVYAYLLAGTVFVLEIIYGFLDPRIKATFR